MSEKHETMGCRRNVRRNIMLGAILTIFSFSARAQITIYPVQDFNFGTFYQGPDGGTVEISTSGTRTFSGSIVLINSGPAPSEAIFDIEAPENSSISILNGPDSPLTGSNGGSITLKLGTTDPPGPFSTVAVPPDRTRIHLAGSLVIGDRLASPPGTYQGTFSITFNQE